ncbi:hypothetical protein KY331_04085 [Candidatus Woesearchaeota archaeon]|nr:hypothetical protein [Candidatus Woesearchaeota archaeon]
MTEEKKEIESEIKDIKAEIKEDISEEKKILEEAKEKGSKEQTQKAEGLIKESKEEEEEVKKVEEKLKANKLKEAESDVKEIADEVKKTEEKSDVLAFDLSKFKDILNFFKQNKFVIPVVCILIAMFFSVNFRMQSADLPITEKWAEDTVYNFIRSEVKASVDKQYPNLPEANKNTLVESQLKEVLRTQKKDLNSQIKGISEEYKKHFQDENGYTYLLAIDPYFYLRHARNYLDYSIAGTEYVGGEGDWTDKILMYPNVDFSEKISWDGQRMAPIGSRVDTGFHDFAIVILYKIMYFFNDDINLMRAAFLIPVIFSALSVIPAFFLGKKVGGDLGGFFAAMLIGVHSAFINRTAGGFSDTDAYNVFFPLLIAWVFLAAFDTKDLKKKIGFGLLTGFLIWLYSTAWKGYWYLAGFIVATMGIYFVYMIVINFHILKKEGIKEFLKLEAIKDILIIAGSVLAVFIIFALIFNVTLITNIVNQPIKFIQIKAVAKTTIWPKVETTVAELNPASLSTTIKQIGGKFLFLIAIIGIILTFITKEKEEKSHIKYGILLIIWFGATIYASTKGLRFILLLVPAFAIAFGVACGIIYRYITRWIEKEIHVDKKISSVVVAILLALLLIGPIKAGYATAIREVPSMNDAWWDSLTKIKEESAPDAIVNSWWDFGHWFITLADRSVTFDGAGQDEHMAHWIGKSILTNDEKMAVGILRMVDCGNNNAFYALNGIERAPGRKIVNEIDETGVLNDTPKSVEILNKIILMSKEDAKKELLKYVPEERAELVLKYTHCDPPENYYITSEDMIGKSGVWAHFGSWDFNKALIFNTLKKRDYRNNRDKSIEFLKTRFDYTEEQADQMYYDVQAITTDKEANNWIAPWPSYAGGISDCGVEDDMVICGNGVLVNLSNYYTLIRVNQGAVLPTSLVYLEGNELVEKKFEGKTVPYSAALIQKGNNSYKSVVMAPELARSTFTRLFFFEGVGSKYFELFSHERGVAGTNIYIWKVKWP